MKAILEAPVDLLWFGGIGTYVRASGESNDAVVAYLHRVLAVLEKHGETAPPG